MKLRSSSNYERTLTTLTGSGLGLVGCRAWANSPDPLSLSKGRGRVNGGASWRRPAVEAGRYGRGGALVMLFLMMTGPFIGGCQKSGGPPADNKPKIALVMKSLANEFFSTMAEGARKHQAANAASYDLIVNGIKNETDLAEQVNLVEQMIARQVNVIVIAPADSKALVTVLKHAKEAGILVVNIDNKLDAAVLQEAGLKVPFVGPDNRAGAR